ncbi:hypothetical protein AC1031_021596 [Aphanomyces cochlioides]|nr:hypothetical protein AC1031_021596 [Aphanomyces cochlioides]
MALIPFESPLTTRKRDLQYRIQHYANSPEQRDDEKRIRPGILLALPAPEPDLSDESMDPRSSSEDLNYSDGPDSAPSATSIGHDEVDEMVMETVNQESSSSSNYNNELAFYLAETSVGQQISTAIVETTKTITTRSIVTSSPSSSQNAHYSALPSSSPPSLEAVGTTKTVTLPWTQPQHLSEVHTSRSLNFSHEPLHLLPPSLTPSPMPLLVAGHEHQVLPPQTGQVTQPTAISSTLNQRGVSNESEMTTSISGPASKSVQHLPSLPLSSLDMDLSLQMVPSDNMEVETPESSGETTLNFSVQMQTLWSQMENYASTFGDFENRLILVSQTSQHQHDLTAASLNSLNSSLCDLADRTSQVQQGLISTRSELHSMISNLKPPKSPIDETDIVRLETALTNQQIAISKLQQSLQLQATEQQRFSEKLQTLVDNRAADFHRILHEVQVLTRAHEESRVATQQQLNQSELTLVEVSSSNKNLGELVIGLTKGNSLLSDRLLSLEGLLEQRETKSTPESVQSTSSVEPPPHRHLHHTVRMESEMSDIKESLDTSINSQAFGRAVKYTTVPTSDEQAHCEFFIKQLVDQAKLCHLSDEECKLLLGLKLTSDKVHPALNQWWIAYSKTKSGDVWTEIYDNFKDRFCNRTQRELVDNLFEESERADGESVKAYAIRLQTILDDIDVFDHQGVVIFKRGVRHARAESCLDNSSLHVKQEIGFRDQATLESILEALKTTQSNQQAFVAQIQHLAEALNKPPNPYFAAPVQHAMNFPYGYPPPYAPGLPPTAPQQPTTNIPASNLSQHATQPQSKPRPAPTPVMISSKPDDCTTSGAKVCGRCDRLGHGSVDCPRKFARCTTCHQIGHYAGEHAKSCSFCKQIGHTYSRCPSKPADKT